MKKNKNKGFTLGELLIVVAIIGVLVAISIPIFTSQLEKAREATDAANIRSQYAEVMTEAITDGGDVNGEEKFGAVELKQKKNEWQSTGLKNNLEGVYQSIEGGYPKAGGTAWVEYKDDQVILHYGDGSGNAGGGSTGGENTGDGSGSGSLANPDEINSSTQLPNAFNTSINDWDKIVSNNPSYNIVPGMVYGYQGSIYFGTSNTEVKNDQYTHQGLNDAVAWFAAAKYTGKIWSSSDFENQRYDITRGDICKVGKDYYVFKDGGNTSSGPEKASWQWQKINLNE
ncbi:MAG: type II secretion system GspH family protein [Solobacterium sp.]|jgi:prepilin-type N-terminal cleavage/methylation domain-containing protein|nr:type II secretion system GspH family protein [Solobacterium sp.]MCH4049233.1 type II secretion system GspH family protein [Solobacterium sp.]MCH4074013.1 type II secretion system GspH family protein [Solobacterium sp.]